VADIDLNRVSARPSHALESRLIEDTMGPDWSPDGTRIAYRRGVATQQDGKATLVIRRADGDVEKERLLPGALLAWQGQVRWSPRGDRLAVLYRGKNASELALLDLRNDELMTVASDVMTPRWEESGDALYFGYRGKVQRFDLKTRQTTVFLRGATASSSPMLRLVREGSSSRRAGAITARLPDTCRPSTCGGECRGVRRTNVSDCQVGR
jgi:Tol biopolymer transport system component